MARDRRGFFLFDGQQEDDREDNGQRGRGGQAASGASMARPLNTHQQITVPIFGPAEQRQIANDMANKTMAAFDKENYSRVAQGREMRRMAHEQELARINAQAGMFNAAADRDAALIRALLAD